MRYIRAKLIIRDSGDDVMSIGLAVRYILNSLSLKKVKNLAHFAVFGGMNFSSC